MRSRRWTSYDFNEMAPPSRVIQLVEQLFDTMKPLAHERGRKAEDDYTIAYLVCVLKRRLNHSKLEESDPVPWATSAGQRVLRRRSPQVFLCTR